MAEKPKGGTLRSSALSLAALGLFLLCLAGQAWAGWAQFNNEQRAAGLGALGLGRYLLSADFAADVAENWQSEYLQFFVFTLLGIWLVQKGSTESKVPGNEGRQSDKDQKLGAHLKPTSPPWAKAGGWRTTFFSWSLLWVMGTIFVVSWFAQFVAGRASFNELRLERLQDPLSFGDYLLNADFWARSLQNWQSEFLAVGSMVLFSVFLRARGSAQSKPVGESHDTTGSSG